MVGGLAIRLGVGNQQLCGSHIQGGDGQPPGAFLHLHLDGLLVLRVGFCRPPAPRRHIG